jgi:hypothetical protein
METYDRFWSGEDLKKKKNMDRFRIYYFEQTKTARVHSTTDVFSESGNDYTSEAP